MTEFEKELKPIEDWIEKMLKGRLPYDREIDVFFCAALIKQYQNEQLILSGVSNRRELLEGYVKHLDKHKDNIYDTQVIWDIDNYLKTL